MGTGVGVDCGVGSTKSNPILLRIWRLFFSNSPPHSPKIIQNSPHLGWNDTNATVYKEKSNETEKIR